MAGYRDRLVHLYYDIGPEELYRILQNELDSFVSFVKEVRAYLDAAGPGQNDDLGQAPIG